MQILMILFREAMKEKAMKEKESPNFTLQLL